MAALQTDYSLRSTLGGVSLPRFRRQLACANGVTRCPGADKHERAGLRRPGLYAVIDGSPG